MKKFLIIFFLIVLASCKQKIGNNIDIIGQKKITTIEQIELEELSINFRRNKDISKDNKTNNQQSNDHNTDNIKEKVQDKPLTNIEEKISYSNIEFIDGEILFKTLDPNHDNTKDKNTSGYITKGENGIKRKEVRKVYINDKYSHTETVKDTYVLKEPIHEQKWIGTKEILLEPEKKPTPPKEEVSKPKDKMVIDGETWYLYKSFDNADACIANINQLQDEHYREWEGGSMCWSEDLYYSLGK